jgi:3-deoxy-7-phosphoheptulonate synthase
MHGNSITTANGTKTRSFAEITDELEASWDVHQACGSRLGGVHFELTGEDVTECLGGARNLNESDLARNYLSPCDPRLNYEQSLELAFLLARRMQRNGFRPNAAH